MNNTDQKVNKPKVNKPKAKSDVYDKDQIAYRVKFAVDVMRRGGSTTRTFDTCFEMGDGDEVAANIYARALKNPKLMEAFPKYLDLESAKRAHAKVFKLEA